MNMIPKKTWVFLTILLLTLTACSTVPACQPPIVMLPPPPIVIPPSQLEVLMQYFESIRKMSATELVKEHDKAKQNLILTKGDTARAELALLLILPNTSFRDTGAALNLLNELPKEAKLSASMRSFKQLLSTLLTEQQRINGSANELSQKLKEEQKYSEVLKNQIDNIKSMEKNLILRDKP
ncbi:dihydrolipoamide acyltransferase [Candidatus Nitrotoga sp. AM1P]|uniref:dihydrolipoamide acyltransferase n=1 Tax=Candidatus Nitrotoga sp. AM1P TaxID=2559597 RepID=UPI0015654A78|nr:dihydrolipoamide acyltransferase [Candidatus Nitrotoga sp. AM1P]